MRNMEIAGSANSEIVTNLLNLYSTDVHRANNSPYNALFATTNSSLYFSDEMEYEEFDEAESLGKIEAITNTVKKKTGLDCTISYSDGKKTVSILANHSNLKKITMIAESDEDEPNKYSRAKHYINEIVLSKKLNKEEIDEFWLILRARAALMKESGGLSKDSLLSGLKSNAEFFEEQIDNLVEYAFSSPARTIKPKPTTGENPLSQRKHNEL